MDFLMHSIKKGKDARSEGIVWMMSTIKRLGGEIREDFLPEFLDEQSKHFLMNKLRVYEKLIENQALYKFYWDVFKGYVGRDENNLTFQNFEILKRQRNAHLTVDDTYIVEPELRIEGSVYDENTLLHVRPDSSIVNYSLKDSLKIVMNRVRNLNSAARPDKSDKKIKFDINEYKQASKSNLDTDREENQQDTSNKLDVIGSIKRSLSARSLSINFDEKFVSASKRVIELKKELGENGDVNWGQLPVGERQKLYSVKKLSELEEKSENEKEYRELNDRSQSDSDILSINENDLNGSRESDKPNPRHYSPPPSQKGMMIKIKEVPEKSSEFDLNIETKDRNYRVENLSMEVEDSQGIEENSIQNQGTPEFQNHLDNECVSGTQSPIFPKNDEISDDKETPLRYDEDNMDSPSLPYIGKNHAADSKKQFTIRSSIKSSENEHRIIRQLKLQRINLTSAATYKSSIPSIFSTGATYICDQNYKLPFEAAISAPKLNYAEVCFRRGRNLVKKLLKQEFRNSKNELQLDDPFNMNVMFYDGETPINNFKSKKEFIDKEIRLEISITRLQNKIDKMNQEEAVRVVYKYFDIEKKRLQLQESLGPGYLAQTEDCRSKAILEKLGFALNDKKNKERDFDFGMYLSCLIGLINAENYLSSRKIKDLLNEL